MRRSPDRLAVAPPPAPSLAEEDPAGAGAVIERGAWSLVWLAVLTGGINLWGWWPSWTPASVVGPALVVAGIIGLAVTWLVPRPRSLLYQLVAMGSLLSSMAIPQAIGIHTRQYYSTDSGAFNQVAAGAGARPQPLRRVDGLGGTTAQTPELFWTYTVNGSHVTHVSYPAGSFLVEVPALWFGFHHQVSDWMDLYAWIATGILLFVILPASLRWLAALIAVTPIFVGVFSSGGTDALFVPFLVLAVWRWDRFAAAAAGSAHPGGHRPACTHGPMDGPDRPGHRLRHQTDPVVLCALPGGGRGPRGGRTGRPALRLGALYLGIVALVFAAVNVPFIIWQPSAWVHGTSFPSGSPWWPTARVWSPWLSTASPVASPSRLTIASALVYVALLIAMVIWFPAMKRVWLFLLPVVFFVAARSLTSYLVDFFPAAVVAAITVSAVNARPQENVSSGRIGERDFFPKRNLAVCIELVLYTSGFARISE